MPCEEEEDRRSEVSPILWHSINFVQDNERI